MNVWRFGLLTTVSALACLGACVAQAQTAPNLTTGSDDSGSGGFSWTALSHQSNALGDMGGLRSFIGQYGFTLNLNETSEVFDNASGGLHQGAEYEGLTTGTLQLNTQKAFGWNGGTFNASMLQYHGRNFSADDLGNLQTASGIETSPSTRLWELWFDQANEDDSVDFKVGQQSIDQEFMVSQGSSLFVNTMMGWPALPSYDMPSGGPAYPLSDLGARLKLTPIPALTVLAGVYNGDPYGDGDTANDDHGTAFNLTGGTLAIAELQYSINQPAMGDMVTPDSSEAISGGGLPGTYKLGFWYNTENFADEEYDNTGVSLASLSTTGTPATHKGDYSIYGIVDQMIWRPDPEGAQSLNVFLRAMGAPSDQNEVSFSVNGGLTLKAPFTGRDFDTAGIGFGYVQISPRLAGFESDTASDPTNYPVAYKVQHGETFLEATYQYQFTPWWQFQPDLQYVFNPNAGENPNDPTTSLGNETIFGLRTNITF